MEITLDPPQFLLWLVLGILGVVALSLLLKKGEWLRKGIAMGITVVVVMVLLVVFYRTSSITVDHRGLSSDTYGTTQIAWDDVERAIFMEKLSQTSFRPARRTNGTAVGDYTHIPVDGWEER